MRCRHEHPLVGASDGERRPVDAPRVWRVRDDGIVGTTSQTFPTGDAVRLEAGTLLRYDQRDYDPWWRHEGWDRFLVLDGPWAGTCVCIFVSMPASPVSSGLEPLPLEIEHASVAAR